MRQRAIKSGKGVADRGFPREPTRGSSLNIHVFGGQLIRTGDLDPVYIGIVDSELEGWQLQRLLVAYWMFYHLGLAAWLSEQDDFWKASRVAALNESPSPLGGRWPRGTERRHFRGESCLRAVDALSVRSPQHWVGTLTESGYDADSVINAMQKWPMFGPWIAYKAADMLERVLKLPITFRDDLCLMYKEPAAALNLLMPKMNMGPSEIYNELQIHFARFRAPPAKDRPCGVTEVETILCKWKAARAGHYHVGKDIHEVRAGLVGWGETATAILDAMPPETGSLF